MGKTMTEKILAKASGKEAVSKGDVVRAKVQVVSLLDSAPSDLFDKYNVKVWDPNRIIFCFDHFFHGWMNGGAAVGHPKVREFARKQGIPRENVYDVGRHGISHQVPVENGWVLPGTVSIAQDTQGATMGAMNCFAMAALGETASILLTGDVWMMVPECIRINLHGRLPRGLLGKDISFRLLKDLGGVIGGRVLEFGGPGVESLPIDVRMGVANGSNHMGALTMVFPPDQELIDYITPRAREPFEVVEADFDAEYVDSYEYDLGEFEHLVSGPHDIELVRPLTEVPGLEVTAAYIGSCSGARLEDLSQAAEVLRDRKIHPNIRLVVTPISSITMQQAMKAGILEVFAEAGATITTPGCGACWFGNQSPLTLEDGERCITSSVENARGRMGSQNAEIYIASPTVVAASAIEGRLADPRKYLEN